MVHHNVFRISERGREPHRKTAAKCFNAAWEYLEKRKRSLDDERQMLLLAQAVLYIVALGIVILPLATYWANVLGLLIDPTNVLVILAAVFLGEILGARILILLRKSVAEQVSEA